MYPYVAGTVFSQYELPSDISTVGSVMEGAEVLAAMVGKKYTTSGVSVQRKVTLSPSVGLSVVMLYHGRLESLKLLSIESLKESRLDSAVTELTKLSRNTKRMKGTCASKVMLWFAAVCAIVALDGWSGACRAPLPLVSVVSLLATSFRASRGCTTACAKRNVMVMRILLTNLSTR